MEQLYLDKKYKLILEKTSQALEKNPTNKAAIYYSALAKAHLGFPYVGLIKLVQLIDPSNDMRQSYQLELDRLMISKMIGDKCCPDKTEVIDHINMPRNFSWVWNGFLIGSSDIKTQQQLIALHSIGVTKIINLIEETNRYELGLLYQNTKVDLYYAGIENRKPPTIEQMDNIMNCCEHEFRNNNQVVVHCGGGKGRAGTVLACLMLKHGLSGPNNYLLNNQPLSPSDVITHLRKIRPESIETDEQELFVKEYHNHLWQQYQGRLDSPQLYSTYSQSFTIAKYPSTPYLYNSPATGDEIFDQNKLHRLISNTSTIVITEKLDGGNCCLYGGRVYARTHSQPTGHQSFNTIKDMYYHRILPMIEAHPELDELAFYGENLTAIHGIEYTKLDNWFYLFGVFCPKRQMWYSWKDVEYVAKTLDVPTPPVLFLGEMTSVDKLKDLVEKEMLSPSLLSINKKEGVVIRSANSFLAEDFGSMVCKYVGERHIQTQTNWSNNWKKAKLITDTTDDIEDMIPPPLPKPIKLTRKSNMPSMILLTGPPASGKSSFANQIKKAHPNITVINQDSLKSRDACEKLVGECSRKNIPFILDRCNPTSEERKYWLKLGFNPIDAVCIHFNLPVDLLIHRAKNRQDHPTIPVGTGETAIKHFMKQMEAPQDSEHFNKIYLIRTVEDMNKLLMKFHAEPYNDDSFYKYPRTCHLFDAREVDPSAQCSVQRDDLLLNHKEREMFFNKTVTIEEKIDGANIGISVNSELKFQFQNRSHYVNSTTHPQFKTLDNWLAEHFQELWDILGSGQYILFGEWCYGVHSLSYKKLTDHFIAFDLYDKWNKKFLSRKRFREIILKTGITPVPILDVIELKSEKQVYKYFSRVSEFDDTALIEGVYIRLDESDFLLDRCKAVSPQFTVGITKSWTQKGLQVNQINK